INFARYCLPQVFFYGMFVLVGQILNARGRFGPMMWAPIANNVISVLVLVIYLLSFGPAEGAERCGGYATGQELLLGLGSTAGIVAQFAILLPYLRAAGFTFQPRFDFRGTGLGHTLRLGSWTLGFVLVNQIAYTVVVRLASSGTAQAAVDSCGATSQGQGTGYAVYASTFLIMMVPHSVVTVSLATAILPRLSAKAAGGDLAGLASTLSGTLRTTLVLIIPFAALLPLIAIDLSNVILGYGAARDTFDLYALSLALFGPGLVFFTVHYLMLRGFYALEQTRTAFWVQTVIAVANIGVALLLVTNSSAVNTAPALVLAYLSAYVVGSAVSYALLRRRLGGLQTPRLLRFLARMAVAVPVATAAAAGVAHLIRSNVEEPSQLVAGLSALAITVVDVVVFLLLARLLRITEVTSVLGLVTQRLGSRRQGSQQAP
ncbi:murein biosynthesis integral membrane protein MurJ, partial [Nocardioides sp.]|uniref:murein biosynthesis integral membrane protein MurJ n=1 Tax=Nocardioides sp. TaxID=35761 RepID=UPI00273333EF